MTDGWWVDREQFSIGFQFLAAVFELPKRENPIYIYKQGWKSIHNKYKAYI
jgi:hypothetical protein